jgi:hypothetical protein
MDELIILYTGENFNEDIIYNNERVKIHKYKECVTTKEIWDVGWQKNVDLKTQFLRDLAVKKDNPIFLIDVDCYFLDEFIDTIDMNCDIAITKREYTSPYIASFVGLIKPKSCLEFIDIWRNIMRQIPTTPRETRALCETVPLMKEKIKIQEIPETIINCINFKSPPIDSKILHFKGRSVGDVKKLLLSRLNNLKSII